MIIVSVFSLNEDDLAKVVFSPDMACGGSDLSLGSTDTPDGAEWLR